LFVVTFCAVPALATGAAFATDAFTVTVDAVLLTFPSLTTSDATYAPAISAMNVGIADVVLLNVAELPAGLLVNVQLYVNASLFASLLLLPFKVTVAATKIFCIWPALATGAVFAEGAVLFSPPPPPPQAANSATAVATNISLIAVFIFILR
jgi:hypothetical protein